MLKRHEPAGKKSVHPAGKKFAKPLLTELESRLFIAVREGNSGKVRELLGKGVDPNIRDCLELTPLMIAASKDYLEIARLLLAHGADVHAKTSRCITALYFAVENKSGGMIRLLIENGAVL